MFASGKFKGKWVFIDKPKISVSNASMKGIVLAGGSGTRLYPLTLGVSKQLVPVYDKPMVYYPISTLMLAGIREILIIATPQDLPAYEKLLGDGLRFGVKFEYVEQPKPEGVAQAFILGKKFIGKDSVALIFGDNIFYGHDFIKTMEAARQGIEKQGGGAIFAYHVSDPERYGVVEFGEDGRAVSIAEKPKQPKSHFAVPGLYFYDNDVVKVAENLTPSDRGELEITDVNNYYLQRKKLKVSVLTRGTAWLDTGTHASLLQAGNFVQIIEERQGLKIGCLEEVAYRMGFIRKDQLKQLAQDLIKSGYGEYLLEIVEENP